MRERGSALLTSVIAVTVLALLAGVFFSISASRARMESSEEKGLKAYYLAEAGVQYAVAYAYEVFEVPSGTLTKNDPFGSAYGGSFTVIYDYYEESDSVIVKSTGQYKGVTRKIEAKFDVSEE